MILRRVAGETQDIQGVRSRELELSRPSSLRSRIATLAAVLVTLAVGATALLSYVAVSGAMEDGEVLELEARTVALMRQTQYVLDTSGTDVEMLGMLVDQFRTDNPGYRVAVSPGENQPFVGDPVPVDRFARKGQGPDWTQETFSNEWVSVLRDGDGVTVALARDTGGVLAQDNRLRATLMGIVGLGTLLAALSGSLIARSTLRPLERLRRSVDRVRDSNELEPIEVEGDDEYSRLAESLNEMMASLNDSRVRQSQLVADAGHELRTPLTSMRTNIELLTMLHRSGQRTMMAEQELNDLEDDVTAQMEEMSTLIGDLVDLAREDVPQKEFEPERLDGVLTDAVERVKRRRPDVEFRFRADPWVMDADSNALSRAPVNLLDNAAKWSPPGGVVRVSLRAAKRSAVLIIDDSGPGIPVEERSKVFERFYRAPESRAMPGSGLGLAITQQVLHRHGATIAVEESDDGGTRIRVVFPGRPVSE
ncbi:HAMP domain-containing histidine kinase [Corynebacterium genitalium ATCC 33030]|uniref:histidine kinase n=1 Tax=Corynebacterium genitalium ATCC 33030 TaxID=585529 RepID=D7WE99_9CORY|nr:HAMP domain-containing sensor histidine kinase [Corynebacterium genitalium]EFK54453.1 ATPase/histidine kinase/DNA gyrase B/HSP90 domain protein [Corynebacterium genitalium ATCC 33030]MCQ4619829.1 HAMP domain-containing histidine kinase [Corynebacterium sp. CCUG 71335]UUA90055.1 HAMP domain-containing histidine kinase [Corynebacterium genitalium ATCC 33030]